MLLETLSILNFKNVGTMLLETLSKVSNLFIFNVYRAPLFSGCYKLNVDIACRLDEVNEILVS